MQNPTFAILVRLAPVLALCSCAAPKAIVVEEVKPAKPKQETAAAPEIPEPTPQPSPDDGLRLPDMMAMPGDEEFRTTKPDQPEPGAVIARPPTEPPPRPKSETKGD